MAQVYALNWDLDSLLPNPERPEFTTVFEGYRAQLGELAARSDDLPRPQVGPATGAWARFLQDWEDVESKAGDLGAFLGCHAAGDAGNKLFRQWEATLSALDPARERIYTNVEFALQSLSESEFTAWLHSHPVLERSAFFLQQRRKNASLRLPRAEELLAADLAVDGLHAWGRLYDRLSGDLRVRIMERGELVDKSPGQVRFDQPDRTVRENHFYAAQKAWATLADTCADALNHLAGTRLTVYRRLKLADHLEAPLRRNRMSRETLDVMWQAISERKAALLPFLECKARLLGLDRLAWFDVGAPLPGGERDEARISFQAGAELIEQTFGAFSGELGDFARHAFSQRWVEAENRGGKRQGAFCTGFPTTRQSRVFMTFTENLDDVSTLAHELGHAYHSWVLREEPLFLQDYPMNLAETASTFAEAILGEHRLKTATTRHGRLAILNDMLGDSVAFLMNIHARFLFEDRFHAERPRGELTASRLSELMHAAQREAYLDALAPDGWYPDFWVSKLHFYISGLPFYNFPYTFGYLLSTGLLALADEMPAEFPERYRRLLIATGNQEAEDAVRSTFGYDLREPAFWHKSLDVIGRRVQLFVETVDQPSRTGLTG